MSALLSVLDLYKSYEGKPLINGVSFDVAGGEIICLLGASGSGKSTILRMITGLEEPESGRVLWQERDLREVPVHQRGFGLMFQDYALFPHRNVAENVGFGLRMQGLPKPEAQQRIQEALSLVGMASFAQRRVNDLSGGEQQRVALARALAPRPRLLMLDEPLGALDRGLREQLLEELRKILRQTGIPAIYVTHDQEEAFQIADRLLLLHQGKLAQAGSPSEVYEHPASAWVARFFGLGNLLEGRVKAVSPLLVETAWGIIQPDCMSAMNDMTHPVGASITLLLRPTGAVVCPAEETLAVNYLHGRVVDVVFRGDGFRVDLAGEAGELRFYLPAAPRVGDILTLALDRQEVICLDDQ